MPKTTTIKEKIEFYGDVGQVMASHGLDRFKSTYGLRALPEKKAAGKFAHDLEQLGPTFTKLGQFLSGRSDLLPQAYIDALSRLQDDAAPLTYSEVASVIQQDLGGTPEILFNEFEDEPLATASLGQVHRAVTKDGRLVAVKIQRPEAEDSVRRDLDALGQLAALLQEHTAVGRKHRLNDVISNLASSLRRELDYRVEANSLQRFHTILEPQEDLIVPLPVDELTSRRVLTMDYLPGQRLEEESLRKLSTEKRAVLVRQLYEAYIHQILEVGTFQADPHPGNFILMKSGNLALLDFGMIGHLTEELRHEIALILMQMAEGRSGKVADLMVKLARCESSSEIDGFKQDVTAIVDHYHELPPEQMKAGKVILSMYQAAHERGLGLPPELSVLARTLLHLDEVGRLLDPNFNPNDALKDSTHQLLINSALDWTSLTEVAERVHDVKKLASQAPAQVNQLLDALAQQRYTLRIDALNEKSWHDQFQKVANRITSGLVIAALLMASAILAHIDTPEFHLFGYPGVALIAFATACFGGLLLIGKIIWSDYLVRS